MKLTNALFKDPEILIYAVVRDDDWDYGEFEDWSVEAIRAPTLASECIPSGVLDGPFILGGQLINGVGQWEPCYLGVSMPEGIVSCTYVKEGGSIHQKRGRHRVHKEAILMVAIEKLVEYNLYYSKLDPEAGLRALRNGLSVAKMRWPIAHAMSCILRDEGRYREAIDQLNTVIAEGPPELSYSNYQERASFLDKIGDAEGAQRDRETAMSLLEGEGCC